MTQIHPSMSTSDDKLTVASKNLVSSLVPSVAKAVRFSHEFPTVATPAFTYYNDFPQYKAVMNGNSNKILSLIQQIIDEVHGEANIMDAPRPKSLEEKFATLVDVNDRVLDRLTIDLDHEENPSLANNNSNQDLVVAIDGSKIGSPMTFKEKRSIGELITPKGSIIKSPVQLLASKNISRPQNLFTVAPDNSSGPFLPILKSKPNAIVHLGDCALAADPETGDYTHPYAKELEEFGKAIDQNVYVAAPSNPVPLSLEETPFIFVNSAELLDRMIKELRQELEIAVDLEHHSYRTFLGITCLIQLSSRTKDYIVDAIAVRDHLGDLNDVFTDPNIVKVLHGSDMDLMWLQRDFGVYIVNLFDTGQAARALLLPRFSLSYLLQNFAATTTNKAYQLADWRIRPLPEELIEYARIDTHYLLYIAEQLRNHLADRGLLRSVLERSRQLCLRIYKKPTFDPVGYLSMYNLHGGACLNNRQLYTLKHLCILRDSIARREDESLHYVLPNHMLRLIAEELPRETTGIFACCSPIPPLVRKYVYDIHRIVLDARNNKLSDLIVDAVDHQFDADRTTKLSQYGGVSGPEMYRAPPHDFSTRVRRFQPVQPQGGYKRASWNKPSSLGKCFSMYNNSLRKPNNAFVDPNRGMLHKLLDMFEAVPISEPQSATDTSISSLKVPSPPNTDPLYKPPSPKTTTDATEVDSVKLTPQEVVGLADLSGGFLPRASGRSAQSRVLANLKVGHHQSGSNRQQQQKFVKGGAVEKRPMPDKQDQALLPLPKRHSGDNAANDDDDGLEVIVLRDQQLKKIPKGTVGGRSFNTSQVDDTLDASQATTIATTVSTVTTTTTTAKLPPRRSITVLPAVRTPTSAAAPPPLSSGRRRRRVRGGRGGGYANSPPQPTLKPKNQKKRTN